MSLDYVALGILIVAVLVLFYGIIVICNIPYDIARRRQHPHQDAIRVACWVSLFTLQLIWPFLWIWAMLYRPDRGWGFAPSLPKEEVIPRLRQECDRLQARLASLERSKRE